MSKIKVGGTYKTNGGDLIKILYAYDKYTKFCGCAVDSGGLFPYDLLGKELNGYSDLDLIEVEENKMKVEMSKKYKLQSGEDITILTTERYPNKAEPTCIGLRTNGEIIGIFSDGIYDGWGIYRGHRNCKLIEVRPFKDEDPVLVKLSTGRWHRAYYAFYKDGIHHVYAYGSKFTSKYVTEMYSTVVHFSEQLEAENNK